jgi:hypothetical protein
MTKSADVHFEPDGSIRLIGFSTANSTEFVSAIQRAADSFARNPKVNARVWTENGGTTLVVEAQVYPVAAKPAPTDQPKAETKPKPKAKGKNTPKAKAKAKRKR